MSELTKDDVVKFIEGMTVLELSQLVKELEARFGVSAAAPVAWWPPAVQNRPRRPRKKLNLMPF
jgi:ribosomal protein L7/L12